MDWWCRLLQVYFLEGMDDEMNEFMDEIYFQTNANTYM